MKYKAWSGKIQETLAGMLQIFQDNLKDAESKGTVSLSTYDAALFQTCTGNVLRGAVAHLPAARLVRRYLQTPFLESGIPEQGGSDATIGTAGQMEGTMEADIAESEKSGLILNYNYYSC